MGRRETWKLRIQQGCKSVCIESLSNESQESLTLGTPWSQKGNRVEASTEKESEVVGVTDTRRMMKIKTKQQQNWSRRNSGTPVQKEEAETWRQRGQEASKAYQMCQNSE